MVTTLLNQRRRRVPVAPTERGRRLPLPAEDCSCLPAPEGSRTCLLIPEGSRTCLLAPEGPRSVAGGAAPGVDDLIGCSSPRRGDGTTRARRVSPTRGFRRASSPRLVALGVAFLLAGVAPAGAADTLRDLIERGNQAFNEGRYDAALQAYEQAAKLPDAKGSRELLHDQAAAHFKLGQLDEARELWARARQLGDAQFEARSHYNLGNIDYARALQAIQQPKEGPSKAMEHLAHAAAQYRDAVRLDPTFADARANLELTQQLKQQLEKAQQQQQQQQQQDPNSPHDPNAPRDPNQQGQGQQQQQQSDQQDPNQARQQQQQQQQQQNQSQNEQQGQQNQQQNQQDASESQQQQDQKQQDQQKQQKDAKQKEQQAQQQAAQSQPIGQPESQPAEMAQQDPNQPQSKLTDSQAERLLQMVRDAERARREALARQRMTRQEPVDKDW